MTNFDVIGRNGLLAIIDCHWKIVTASARDVTCPQFKGDRQEENGRANFIDG